MSPNEAGDSPDSLFGRPVEEAVDAVVAAADDRDRETARATLERVAEAGEVTRAGVDGALVDVSQAISTAEGRIDDATTALADARTAAESMSDVDAVAARLDYLDGEIDSLRDRLDGLSSNLQAVVVRDDTDGAFALATDVRDLDEAANAVQREAQVLQSDAESVVEWLDDASVRYDDLAADLDALEEAIANLADAADTAADLADSVATGDAASATEDAEGQSTAGGDRPADDAAAVTWLDATFSQRVLDLFVADVRAELADLRTLAERTGEDRPDREAALDDRIDDLDAQVTATGERLDDLARPAWRDRFGDRIAALEADLAAFELPVQWDEVRATLNSHAADIETDA